MASGTSWRGPRPRLVNLGPSTLLGLRETTGNVEVSGIQNGFFGFEREATGNFGVWKGSHRDACGLTGQPLGFWGFESETTRMFWGLTGKQEGFLGL